MTLLSASALLSVREAEMEVSRRVPLLVSDILSPLDHRSRPRWAVGFDHGAKWS